MILISKHSADGGKLVAPVGTDFFRMQSEHGIAIAWITRTGVEDGVARLQVDGGQEYCLAASLAGSLNDGIAVFIEFLAVKMAMGVDVVQIEN